MLSLTTQTPLTAETLVSPAADSSQRGLLWALLSASGNRLTRGYSPCLQQWWVHGGPISCLHSWPSWGALAAPELPQGSAEVLELHCLSTVPLPILVPRLPSPAFQRALLNGLPACRSPPGILFPGEARRVLEGKEWCKAGGKANKQKTRQRNILQ